MRMLIPNSEYLVLCNNKILPFKSVSELVGFVKNNCPVGRALHKIYRNRNHFKTPLFSYGFLAILLNPVFPPNKSILTQQSHTIVGRIG